MSAFMCNRDTIVCCAVSAMGTPDELRGKLRDTDDFVTVVVEEIATYARRFYDANVASVRYLYPGRQPVPSGTGAGEFPMTYAHVPCGRLGGFERYERRLTTAGEQLLAEARRALTLPFPTRIQALACFHYQACEPPDYTQEKWFADYAQAMRTLLSEVPGTYDAPWGLPNGTIVGTEGKS